MMNKNTQRIVVGIIAVILAVIMILSLVAPAMAAEGEVAEDVVQAEEVVQGFYDFLTQMVIILQTEGCTRSDRQPEFRISRHHMSVAASEYELLLGSVDRKEN